MIGLIKGSQFTVDVFWLNPDGLEEYLMSPTYVQIPKGGVNTYCSVL